jgi:hypothetical protein
MMPMNNPLMQIMGLLQSGKNPNAILQTMAMNNPQVKQVMQMMRGKSPEQLRQIANNMAAERGTTVEDIARQLGIQVPSNR